MTDCGDISLEEKMDLVSSFQVSALYNQRMNGKLIDVCGSLCVNDLNKPTGAFFPTVLDHWNHLLFADLIMLQRLVDNGFIALDTKTQNRLPVSTSINDKFVSNLDDLSSLRAIIDAIYIRFTQSLTDEMLTQTVCYQTTEGQQLERSLAEFCMHVFNHQTHHRGQITCLLSQYGLDYGSTDLPVVIS